MSTTDVVRISQQGPSTEEDQGRLKADLQYLKRRSIFRGPGEISYQGRKCTRCGAPFGRFYNTGAPCTRCRHRVCRQCRIEVRGPADNKAAEWICNLCYKIAELHVVTGEWMYEGPVSAEHVVDKRSTVDLLRHTIRRAWTINGPPTRWSAARKSPELRLYRSLPTRHQDYRGTIEGSEARTLDKEHSRSEETRNTAHRDQLDSSNDCPKDEPRRDQQTLPISRNDQRKDGRNTRNDVDRVTSQLNSNERNASSKRNEKSPIKQEEEVSTHALKQKKIEKHVSSAKTKDEEAPGTPEQSTSRISLIKPPKILTKLISPDVKTTPTKYGERKSNIPIFKRSSKEFEDIRSPQESPKRSLIPQRYRGSTDDLRRSREDISLPSLIPKLLTPRGKEERLKRQDSKDDVRPRSCRRDSKDESPRSIQSGSKEDSTKISSRIFRRESSREDVGRNVESANSSACLAAKGKQQQQQASCREEKQERAEERVGDLTTSKSRSSELNRTTKLAVGEASIDSRQDNDLEDLSITNSNVPNEWKDENVTLEGIILERTKEEEELENNVQINQQQVALEEEEEGKGVETFAVASMNEKHAEDSMKDSVEGALDSNNGEVGSAGGGEKKTVSETVLGKKQEDYQVVRRKFSKEEFSNPDDTDDTPNKRCSSHLSPEASPLSTRSSRYSPRESESEPTPALPRKTGGDSCSASQRIRDAITRTRRESNSSARYESSGSESVRLSETGLHGYVELARKVKFLGGTGSGTVSSIVGCDEVVQRDSATSAGEDDAHDDNHGRAGPVSSQGRTMLRRRRQFDAQGSRRRGRSHARSCCSEDLQSLQALHVIGRGGRQQSPTNQNPDQPIVDYRRLVFISSDSSSGREEDDADSSCSSSSYLNGLPRGGGHAQSLEDCDWDYFESGTLPLPTGVPVAIGVGNVTSDPGVSQDWSCCPGRGSSSCQACGGSRGTNVLPVPVPIPVPVPYPVPVPAALWTGDFAAAASSMISRGGDAHSQPGTLRLRGDPAAPWFAWHPRFNQPLHGARLDPRLTGIFEPQTCGFRPDQILTPKLYESVAESSPIATSDPPQHQSSTVQTGQDENDDAKAISMVEENFKRDISHESNEIKIGEQITSKNSRGKSEVTNTMKTDKETNDRIEEDEKDEEKEHEESLSDSFDRDREDRMYQHLREDSGSSSGRSSADSSDLEDDSSSHRFSRVFVVNDDSLTSDNDIEDNEEEDDSDSAAEGGVALKRVTGLPDEDPVILQHVRLLNEDSNLEKSTDRLESSKADDVDKFSKVESKTNDDSRDARGESVSAQNIEKKKSRGKKNNIKDEERRKISLENRLISEEVYLGDTDSAENPVELKAIKNLDPDSIEESICVTKSNVCDLQVDLEISQNLVEDTSALSEDNESKSSFSTNLWDSNIIPDSLEMSNAQVSNSDSVSFGEFESNSSKIRVSTPTADLEAQDEKNDSNIFSSSDLHETSVNEDSKFVKDGDSCLITNIQSDPEPTNIAVNPNSTDSSTNNESTTTGSEISSDELHEYEVNPPDRYSDIFEPSISAINDELLHTVFRNNKYKSTPIQSVQSKFDNTVEKYKNGTCYEDPNITPKSIAQYEKSQLPNNPIEATSNNGIPISDTSSVLTESNKGISLSQSKEEEANLTDDLEKEYDVESENRNVTDMLSMRIQGIFKSPESTGTTDSAHDANTVRGESPGQVVGDSDINVGGNASGGKGNIDTGESSSGGDCAVEGEGSTRFRSVERRPSTRKENGFPPAASTKDSIKDAQYFPSSTASPPSNNNNNNSSSNNRYRSLVMITQEASYQPVSVITSDTTTLLQPDEVHSTGQGLAGYFQLALETVDQPHRKNGQGPRRPLMVKRSTANQSEPEVDSGLSVGSASESDDVSVKNPKSNRQKQNGDKNAKERQGSEQRDGSRARASSQSSDDNSSSGGVVILEEGLADDDSWVEEVSHDEDEQATTATEESSEDEANNLGDREEELRGYNRQAIDLTLHTIIEESCEESEAEPSLATESPSKKPRPPSTSELEKYFFFGLGEGNNSSMGSREVDSLSETSSIYSEGLESLGQDETGTPGQNQERSNNGDSYSNSRLEKYFLSEFLGFDQDRRDSDGSVGSDSEGRPSPEAQRRKKLVRARGTGRSHSSSLDNLLALTQSSQNLSSQNSLQDLSLNQDAQETQSEGSSTETDGAEEAQTPVFGTDGQFDTVKRKKKKPRNLGTQSPRVPDDRNKTPEPAREMVVVGEVVVEGEGEAINSEDSERAKTPQPEIILSSSLSSAIATSTPTTSQLDSSRTIQHNSGDSASYGQRSKQQSRDSGFVGSCDDLLQHQKSPEENLSNAEVSQQSGKERSANESGENASTKNQQSQGGANRNEKSNATKVDPPLSHATLPHLANASLSRKDSFNNWSSDEETNLMMSKMRQFFKTMVATSNGQSQNVASTNSSGASPAPSPRLPGYSSKSRLCSQNRTKPPQLVYFENELTRLMKTVPGIRDDQVREIVEYLSSEDTWSDSYDSSDYTSSDLEGAAGGRRSALQEQISQSCQQIISKFDTTSGDNLLTEKEKEDKTGQAQMQPPCLGRDTAFVYQKLVQSFTKMAGDGVSSDANSTPHSSPPLIAKVMHHIGSRLVALMHEVSEGGPAVQHHSNWRRYSQHHRTPSSASTTEDDDSTSDSTNAPSSAHLQLPRSKSHDPLLLINNHPTTSTGQEGEEREASDYERFSWRGSFESALMAADSRTKLSLLACSGDVSAGPSASASALAMAAKRRSAGDLLFNPKSFSREQLDRVRSCGSIGGGSAGATGTCSGSIEERIWSNRRRSSVPDANTRGESGASAGDEDTEDELEYGSESRATTLPRGMQAAMTAATNSLPRLPASTVPAGSTTTPTTPSSNMHKAHSVYHFLPQHTGVKSARYRPPGFARNSNVTSGMGGPKRAVSAPGLQVSGSQSTGGKRDNSRTRRQQAMSLTPDDGSSLSEACSTPIIGAGSRASSSHTVMDMDDIEPGLHGGPLATRASLSSLGARSDSMASVYSGAGEGRCCRSVVVTGEVEFALQYDYKHLTFEVHVTKCKNLAPVDVKRKRSDPYVKVYLLPDKSKSGKRKTKVKKHTLNPEFNETLKFHMSLSGLETRTLWLTVWHSDMFGRNDFLGEVRMPLENKIFDDPTPKWYPLQERTEPFDDPVAYKGEVIVGLKFVPPDPAQQEREREGGTDHRGSSKARKNWSRGALHVLVKEARNLQTRNKNSGTCDPFCKSYLLPDKGRSGKQKTGVVRRSGGSPVWGHTFIYKDVSLQELAERGLELTVWDHDRIASNEFLGGVRFNLGTGKHYGKPVDWMDATGRELSLWQSMLERPNFWVEGAVTLRPNLHNHGKNGGS